MERRDFLKAAGMASAVGLAGCITQTESSGRIGDVFNADGTAVVVTNYETANPDGEAPRADVTMTLANTTNNPLDLVSFLDEVELSIGRQTYSDHTFADETASTELLPGELLTTTLRFTIEATEPTETDLLIGRNAISIIDGEEPLTAKPVANLSYSDSVTTQSTAKQNNISYDVVFYPVYPYGGGTTTNETAETTVIPTAAQLTITNNRDDPVQFDKNDVIYKNQRGVEQTPKDVDTLTDTPIQPDETRTVQLTEAAAFARGPQYVAVDRDDERLGTKFLLLI